MILLDKYVTDDEYMLSKKSHLSFFYLIPLLLVESTLRVQTLLVGHLYFHQVHSTLLFQIEYYKVKSLLLR